VAEYSGGLAFGAGFFSAVAWDRVFLRSAAGELEALPTKNPSASTEIQKVEFLFKKVVSIRVNLRPLMGGIVTDNPRATRKLAGRLVHLVHPARPVLREFCDKLHELTNNSSRVTSSFIGGDRKKLETRVR
jgi:hypothetical protein